MTIFLAKRFFTLLVPLLVAAAVEARLPVRFLVCNNNDFGEIKRFMEEGNIPRIGVDIYTTDFIGLGKAFGCHTVAVVDLDQLKTELASAVARELPTMIEVKQQDFITG